MEGREGELEPGKEQTPLSQERNRVGKERPKKGKVVESLQGAVVASYPQPQGL